MIFFVHRKLFPPLPRLFTRTPERRRFPTRTPSLTTYLIDQQARSYRLAYGYLQNQEDALDAVQTAACRALERQHTLRDPAAIHTWFTRILVNACMDQLRLRGRVIPLAPEDLDSGSYEDPLPEDGTLARRILGLPPEIQTVIRLRFFEDLSLREISQVTGCPLSTVKTRLYTGLKKLRISLEGEDLT